MGEEMIICPNYSLKKDVFFVSRSPVKVHVVNNVLGKRRLLGPTE